jgi:hypothetical protein
MGGMPMVYERSCSVSTRERSVIGLAVLLLSGFSQGREISAIFQTTQSASAVSLRKIAAPVNQIGEKGWGCRF